MLQDELGAPWHEVYAELTPEPIAAASLGQVRECNDPGQTAGPLGIGRDLLGAGAWPQ